MSRMQLNTLSGSVLGAPADDVTLAVADALLPVPLPPALRAFLRICDGAQARGIEVFGAERLTETTNRGAYSWQLPADTLVIGAAGPGRALIMTGGRDDVEEVDDDPWDARTIELAADTPLDLFVRHRGIPLRNRAPWTVLPGLGAALEVIRTSLTHDVEELLATGIASRVGEPLPSSLRGFRRVGVASGALMLAEEDEYQMFLVNERPEPLHRDRRPGRSGSRPERRSSRLPCATASAPHRTRTRTRTRDDHGLWGRERRRRADVGGHHPIAGVVGTARSSARQTTPPDQGRRPHRGGSPASARAKSSSPDPCL